MSASRGLRRSVVLSIVVLAATLWLSLGVPAAPAAVHAQTGCQELIVNGGFENGHEGWTQFSSQSYELIDPFYPRTGEFSAWLAAYNNEEDWISQTVKLPSGGRLRLTYWWAVFTEENPGGAFDFLNVQLLRVDGALLATVATHHNESAEAWLWNQADLDLSAYAGETLRLRFWAKNDANNPTSFFVDDVSLTSCAASGTPTPTATVTPGPSPTPSATPRFRLYLPLVIR